MRSCCTRFLAQGAAKESGMESFYPNTKGLSTTCSTLQRRVTSPAPSRGEDKLFCSTAHLTSKSPKCPKLPL